MIAALYVAKDGCYSGLPEIDVWDEARDARSYPGPYPCIAHPPCQRWGRFWHGAPNKPHQYKLGADAGCFAAALTAVRNFGGVLEHPKDSRAWDWFGLTRPRAEGGWIAADQFCGWTCCVDQGHYGHFSNKPTWLYAVGRRPHDLQWGRGKQRIPQWMIDRYGYEKARRIGVVAMVGGKRKTEIRNATPVEFRDLLISIVAAAAIESPTARGEK